MSLPNEALHRARLPEADLIDYFQEAAMLRLSLAYNREDFEFASRGGRIVYIFDANIVRFFADPEREDGHIKPFRTRNLDYAPATALITAEFLFSRSLSGQDELPAYVAPGHSEELAEFIKELVERNTNEPEPESQEEMLRGEELRASLENIVKEAQSGELNAGRGLVERLRRLVPHLAEHSINDWSAVQQLRRLYENDLIRPLALHTGCTQEILWPKPQLITEWTKRIRAERTGQRRGGVRNNARDAEALIQVMALDETAFADEDGAALKYVLVTADNALYDAYAKWYWNENSRRELRFVLRRPLQYIPVLNSLEMPNNETDASLSQLAADALDSLFSNLKGIENAFPHKLAYYRILAREPKIHQHLDVLYGVDPLRFDDGIGEEYLRLRDSWNKTFRTGVLLNINLIHRRFHHQFGRLLELLNSARSLNQLIRDDFHDNLSRIQIYHARFATRLNLAHLLEQALHSGADDSIIPRSRIPFLLRTEAFGLPEGFSALLRAEPSADELRDLARLCASKLHDMSEEAAMFAAAAIAYRCGHWSAARMYTKNLLSAEPVATRLRTELEYVFAASTRHALGNIDTMQIGAADHEEALLALDQSLLRCEQNGDPFGRLRALIEQAALRLIVERRTVLLDEQWPDPQALREANLQMLSDAAHTPAPTLTEEEEVLLEVLTDRLRVITLGAATLAGCLAPAAATRSAFPAATFLAKHADAASVGAVRSTSPIVLARKCLHPVIGNCSTDPSIATLREQAAEDAWTTELDRREIDSLVAAFRQQSTQG